MNITLGESHTAYHGKKEKIAVVGIEGNQVMLGLGDTMRCARSLEAAERLLVSLARKFGVSAGNENGAANQLHNHCRKLAGFKVEEGDET